MRVRDLICIFITIWVAHIAVAQSDSASIRPQSVGLVLSGGGAKGIAHIGVIQALEDNDIPIDYITGTSMGAIVGSLYACGYTPQEMMQLITSREFALWAKGEIDRKLSYYYLQDGPTPSIINLNIAEGDSTRWKPLLPSSLISPLPMNMAFMELYSPYTLQASRNFDNLFVPFRAISSDMTAKKPIIWSSGSLADAVRSSMSFPLVFHPLVIDGHLLYDGGIFDNFPVDVMSSTFAPEFMLGVDVANTETASEKTSVINQLETMIMQHSDYTLPEQHGIKLRIHLEQYSLLDFDKANKIYQIGYDHAMAMMDSIKSRVSSRIPSQARELRRDVFKSHTPALTFDSVDVTGGSVAQQRYLKNLFTGHHDDNLNIDDVRDAYYRAISDNRFTNLVPEAIYDDSTHRHILSLTQDIHNKINLGVGGYFTTATNSTLYLTAGYKTLTYRTFDINIAGWLGQSYIATHIVAKLGLSDLNSSSLQLSATVSRDKLFEKPRMFFQSNSSTRLTTNIYLGRLAYSMALGRNAKASASAEYCKADLNIGATTMLAAEKMSKKTGQLKLDYDYNTLDSWALPTSGLQCQLSIGGATGNSRIKDDAGVSRHWLQTTGDIAWYQHLSSSFSLGIDSHWLFSTLKPLSGYAATIADAPAYTPIQCLSNIFSDKLRSYNYAAIGLMPIWKAGGIFQLRGKADCFIPMRQIVLDNNGTAKFGRWWGDIVWTGQIEGILALRFANLSAYAAYTTANTSRWNFGVSLGVFLKAK